MDEDDEFFDTLSLTSAASLNRKKFNNPFSVSSNTLYHSIVDFDMEMDNLDSTEGTSNHVNQVSANANPKTITYSQWRDRVLFLFNWCTLMRRS